MAAPLAAVSSDSQNTVHATPRFVNEDQKPAPGSMPLHPNCPISHRCPVANWATIWPDFSHRRKLRNPALDRTVYIKLHRPPLLWDWSMGYCSAKSIGSIGLFMPSPPAMALTAPPLPGFDVCANYAMSITPLRRGVMNTQPLIHLPDGLSLPLLAVTSFIWI